VDRVKLLVFHDERFIPKKWLYHGFVFCEPERFPMLKHELLQARADAGCSQNKRIHFSSLSSYGASSSRTRTAIRWARLFKEKLYENIWFYLFGVNIGKIDYQFFGPLTNGQHRDYRIYNRFFEIGLFSACRYLFDTAKEEVEILKIFSEERSLQENDPFLGYAPYRINRRASNIAAKCKKIIFVAGDPLRENDNPECVEIVNFVDTIIGAFSEVIDRTGNQHGCLEVAQELFPVCQKLSENPYNINSRYYKRYAMSFFPRSEQRYSQLIQYGIKPPNKQFYPSRALRLYQPKCLLGFEKLIT